MSLKTGDIILNSFKDIGIVVRIDRDKITSFCYIHWLVDAMRNSKWQQQMGISLSIIEAYLEEGLWTKL